MKDKKMLVVFTNGFPYNNSEPFFCVEFYELAKKFEKVLIVTPVNPNVKNEITIKIPENVYIESDYTLAKDKKSIIATIPRLLIDRDFYVELCRLIISKRLSLKRIYDVIVATLCGNHRASVAHKWLKKNSDNQVKCIYSYWMNIPAYAAYKLKKKCKQNRFTVSRAHGFDLYEERYSTKYLPYQKLIFDKLDYIATISQNGKEYLENKYGINNKIGVWYLGAKNNDTIAKYEMSDTFRLISCSRMVSVKRLDRIIDALMQIKNVKIKWTHVGDGEKKDSVIDGVKRLPSNIEFDFRGMKSNEEVYDIYKTEMFDVFVNASESEGIPVAVMEAMSFGIPVIATDVGGTSELVDHLKNGYIIENSEKTPIKIIEAIEYYRQLNLDEYCNFRKRAREKFISHFDAYSNSEQFVDFLFSTEKQ